MSGSEDIDEACKIGGDGSKHSNEDSNSDGGGAAALIEPEDRDIVVSSTAMGLNVLPQKLVL